MTEKKKNTPPTVAVLYGGRSTERHPSLVSALFFVKYFPTDHPILLVHIDEEGRMFRLKDPHTSSFFAKWTLEDMENVGLKTSPLYCGEVVTTTILPHPMLPKDLVNDNNNLDFLNAIPDVVVFPVLHGQNGEDGRIQGLLEMAELPFVGNDVRASVLGADKSIAKRLAKEAGVSVTPSVTIDYDDWKKADGRDKHVEEIESTCGYPCFVKPNSCGTSVGVGRALDRVELLKKLEEAFRYDNLALVEMEIGGMEYTINFLGTPAEPRLSLIGAWETPKWLSYEWKNDENKELKAHMPVTHLSEEEVKLFLELTMKVVRALRPCGLARIDFFRCDKTGLFLFNELTTMPFCEYRCEAYNMLWNVSGVEDAVWIEGLVREARRRWEGMRRLAKKLL